MADVLIRGLEMPKSCDECRFHVDGWCYGCEPESDDERRRTTTKYCPLVELPPHGRLIDADALLKDVRKHSESYFADDFAHEWVDVAPTIIPAESEYANDKNSGML